MSLQVSVEGGRAATPAETLLKAGQLGEALQALTAQVRGNPADAAARVFLFQLLAASGQWERAATQLEAGRELDAGNAVLAAVYGPLLDAERTRQKVFSGAELPTLLGEPEAWMALLLQALRLDAQGLHDQAAQLRAQAFEQAPATAGRIDDAPFAWLADADPRFGPCLEMVANGRYGWAPLAHVAALDFDPPQALCDTLWAPVRVTWRNGGQVPAFVPARYPGSENADEDALRLGRRTDWTELGAGTWAGLGQRMLATDAGDHPLLDVRRIVFDLDLG
ncbi:type VI secretion system accessory protein TagJ [Coralloluteibacterium thermophilus]|uniref:Type VI secretion system accessory protein TagJ n=1 Tax=Coralloluteibacterium thermophilum TaxID=2707049 RepID=A0ABV9NPF1_9GAMM